MKKMMVFVFIVTGLGLAFGYFSGELKAEDKAESFQMGNDQVVMDGNSVSIVGHPSAAAQEQADAIGLKRFQEAQDKRNAARESSKTEESESEGQELKSGETDEWDEDPESDETESAVIKANYIPLGVTGEDLARKARGIDIDERRDGETKEDFGRSDTVAFPRRR